MGQRLSRGIRIYEHAADRTLLFRDAYNYYQGMNELGEISIDPTSEIFGVGTESGAMVVHVRYRFS